MKIYFFFESLFPDKSGCSLRAHYILNLFRDEYDIAVITGTKNPEIFEQAEIFSVKIKKEKKKRSLIKRIIDEFMLGLRSSLKMIKNKHEISIIYISSPSFIASLIVGLFSNLFKVPYIYEVRDLYPEGYSDARLISKNSILYKILDKLVSIVYHHAKKIITATEGLKEKIKERVHENKIDVVYNGFPSDLLSIKQNKYNAFTVCFHGTFGYFQDIETLLSVTEKLGQYNIDVVVIGEGVKRNEITNANLKNLNYLGFLSLEDTISEIAKCHVGLSLRLNDQLSKDSFPIKVWEYLGLGIPVIITPISEAGCFVENFSCGFQFDSGDCDAIINKILLLRDNQQKYTELSDKCKNIRLDYTREIFALKLKKIILDSLIQN